MIENKFLKNILSLQKYIKTQNIKNFRPIQAGAIVGDGRTEISDGEISLVLFEELEDNNFTLIKKSLNNYNINKLILERKQNLINIDLNNKNLQKYVECENDKNLYKLDINDIIYYFQKSLLDKLLKCFNLNQTKVFKGKDCIILEEIINNNILKRGCLMRYRVDGSAV